MNLVKQLQEALEAAGFRTRVTYDEDADYFPTVHVGEWGIGVDGSCLNLGLGPYSVTHPMETRDDGEEFFRLSPMLMGPEQVVEYLREQGLCS